MNGNRRGFTLVEIIIVIVIIGVLATIVTLGLNKIMQDSRDSQRATSSTALVESLEKYYMKNGEYPSIPMVASDKGATPTNVATKIDIDASSLKMPQSSTDLSLVSTDSTSIGSDDVIVYDAASTVNSFNCTDSSTGGCDRYALTYQKEDGTEVELKSRHDNTVYATTAIAPVKPSIALGQNGNTIEGESSDPNCATNNDRLVAKYRFNYQTNSQGWLWSGWQTSDTYGVPGVEGSQYSMRVITRCDDGTLAGVESVPSDPDTYTFPVGAPAAPTITVAINTNSKVQATSSVLSCAAGTTPQYSSRYRTTTNNGAWGSYTAWSTTRTSAEVTPTQGYTYGFMYQGRCYNTSTSTGGGVTTSAEKTYLMAVSAPAAPAVTVALSSSKVMATSAAVTCASGSTAQYSWRTHINTAAWGSYSAWSTTRTSSQVTPSQGDKYGYTFQVRCINTTTNVASGAVASSEASYVQPINTPGAPNVTLNTSTNTWSWTASTCGAGTPVFQYKFSSSTAAGSYSSDTTAKSAKNSSATSQGIRYYIYVIQKCTNSNDTSSWSSSDSSSFVVPVAHRQLRNLAMKLVAYGSDSRMVVQLQTYSGACASGTIRETKIYMSWNTPGKNDWYAASGSSDDDPWFTATDNQQVTLIDHVGFNGRIYDGEMDETKQYTRCRNTSTNYVTDSGGDTSNRNYYDIGNIYNRDDTKYQIACVPNGWPAYCAGGYNGSGTKTSTSDVKLECRARSEGIDGTDYYWTARYNFGSNPPCWN